MNTFARTRRVLRLPAVMEACGLSRASIYRLAALNQFPKPFKIGPRASAWDAAAIDEWLAERMQQHAGA